MDWFDFLSFQGTRKSLLQDPEPENTQKVQTKLCVLQDLGKGAVISARGWGRPAFECLSVSWGQTGQQWPATGTGALAAAILGGAACGRNPLGGGHHEPHLRAIKQVTHKLHNNYTKEVLTLWWKFWCPQQPSQPGDPAKGLRTCMEFDFEGQQDLITELTQDGGNRDGLRVQKKTFLHQGPGERSSDPTRDWARLASECSGVCSGGVGRQRPATGSGTLTAAVLGGVHAGRSPFVGRHYHHNPCRSLASGQTTGRGHSPTHQQKISSEIY